MTTPRHGVTEQDARALAYLARRLRQETYGANDWDEPGIMAELKPLLGQNLAIAIERVTRHAADPAAKTPGAIRRPFVPGPPQAEAMRPPKADDACPNHPGGWRGSCSGCAADALAGDTTPRPRTSRKPASEHIAALRAAHAAALGDNPTADGGSTEEETA